MRAVTFVDRLTLEIPGSVAQCGIFLADVNDDGESELIVGTTEGDLFIYKEGWVVYFIPIFELYSVFGSKDRRCI